MYNIWLPTDTSNNTFHNIITNGYCTYDNVGPHCSYYHKDLVIIKAILLQAKDIDKDQPLLFSVSNIY